MDEEDEGKIVLNRLKLRNDLFNYNKDLCKINDNIIFSLLSKKIIKKHNETYFVDIKNTKEHYIGVLTSKFKKELFGYNLFYQGDEYLGQILNEKKNGFGIYIFNGKENKNKDIYIGYFAENKINVKGIYINILNIDDKTNPKQLTEYNCNIGIFENGNFKKGKIYTVNNNSEKLEFKEDKINVKKDSDLKEKDFVNIEKKDGIYVYSRGILKDKRVTKGSVIHIKDNGDIANKFSFELKNDLQYDFKYLNDEKTEKKLFVEFNKLNFIKFRDTVQGIFNQVEDMIDKMKKDFNYAKGLNMGEDFKNYFSKNFNLLMN